MKKILFAIALIGCIGTSTFFTVNNAEAYTFDGSSYTIESYSGCASGMRYKCEGSGTICETTKWICYSNNQ